MTKRHYESYIILDGNFEDPTIEEIIKKYEKLLSKNKVEIKNIDKIGRRRLAYPIKKKQNGYYICFEFTAAPDFTAKIEKAYKMDENILRYLTIIMSKNELKSKENYLKKKAIILQNLEAEKEKQEQEKKNNIKEKEEEKD
ncbi:MAG: 30S ribosomal protein S6 [Ignavibacteria bacterium]|nr:30S ribosomal protein S6 [Ignavibacteria bacterium]